VARRRDRLEALAQRLHDQYQAAVEVLVADLTKPDQLRTVERRIAEDSALDMLVNNAGFAGYMPFVQLDPDRAEELIDLHVVALTRLTRAALPGMIERGRGTIINVSSGLAFSGALPWPYLPKRATYAACKAYINTFTQLLHQELAGTGVQVQALCPGLVQTEFHQGMGMEYPPDIMTPEVVVDASLAGLRLGEVICVPMLDDPNVLKQIEDSQHNIFANVRRGTPADRYKSDNH
jgi:short-subunit dehydrogenase